MQQVKVPKEVMELMYEAEACDALAGDHDGGWFPSLKAIYYETKAVKAKRLAWRALSVAHPEVLTGEWVINETTGMAACAAEPEKPKKPRKKREPKVEVKPETKEGDAQ